MIGPERKTPFGSGVGITVRGFRVADYSGSFLEAEAMGQYRSLKNLE